MINITLDFDKRFEGKIPDAATYPGIYAVWAYKDEGGDSKWVLLDVGQAKNMADRHATHERKPQWLKYAKDNAMKLIYYTAEINNDHNYIFKK